MKKEKQQLEQWKSIHKHVVKIVSETDPKEYAYFRQPTLEEIEKTVAGEPGNLYEQQKKLFEECVLEEKAYDEEFIYSAGETLISQALSEKGKTIDETRGADSTRKAAAVVRQYFHVDPYQLPAKEFYQLLSEALWLQKYHNKQLETIIHNSIIQAFTKE